MSEYHVRERIVFDVLETTEDNKGDVVCYLMDDFDTEEEAYNYLKECEEQDRL